TILEQLPSGVLAIDLPEGRLSLSNSRALEIWDKPLEPNATLQDIHRWLYEGHDIPLDVCPLVRSAERGEVVRDAEISFVRGDGETRHVSFNSSPVYNDLGEMLAVVATATDITDYHTIIAALEEREELLRLVVETLPVGLWIVDVHGRRIVSNEAADEIFGTPETIHPESTGTYDIRDAHTGEPVEEWPFMDVLRGGDSNVGQLLQVSREGESPHTIICSSVPVRDVQGGVVAALVVQQDVTELRETRSMLRQAEERYKNLVERMPAVTYVAEPWEPHRLTYISPQIEGLLGYSAEEIQERGNHWMLMESPEERAHLLAERYANRTSDAPPHVEYELITREGKTVWVRDVAVLLRDEDGAPVCWQGVLMDITERKHLEFQLLHQAFHDSLTGLPNRELFANRTEHALARASRTDSLVAVLFIDLDNFKVVNDSLGHSAGDRLVSEVGDRLLGCLRSGDTVARMGGDEFTVLVEDAPDPSVVIDLAQRIMRVFKHPFEIDEHQVFVTPSIGVRYSVSGNEDAQTMIRDADLAMYQAKENGRNRIEVFESSLTENTFKRFKIEADLHRAIRDDEFELHYQPIYSFDDGRVVAVEALIRWTHPELGQVAPSEFITVAENAGLIVPIGLFTLEEACRQIQAWQRADDERSALRIWVNVSGLQIADPDLIGTIADLIEKYGIQADRLGLEITESTMMENQDVVLSRLHDLRDLGIGLAIDDFGTGYSSLGALRQFPVDTLKIDRGFVNGLLSHSDDLVIVAGILSLADALSLDVIAEGIENADQLERLRELGCQLGQGFYMARPASITDITDALLEGISDATAGWEIYSPQANPVYGEVHGSIETLRDRYLNLIIDGNQSEAMKFVDGVLQSGSLSELELCLQVIQPALYEIGERWERGDITVAHEHLATLITIAAVHRICDRHDLPKVQQTNLLLAGVQGEQHDIGAQMVAGILQSRGFGVLYLGTDVPHESLIEFAREFNPQAILLSVTIPPNGKSALEAIHRLRIGYSATIPILVGGQGADLGTGLKSLENVYVTSTVFDAIELLNAQLIAESSPAAATR
ncbi:MAG: EAL domain-containing protein, partial [Chloroflexota bacterium]